MGVGVLDGTKANSAPNLVGVGAGAELGNKLWLKLCQAHIQLKFLADQILPSLDWILEYKR